MNEQAMYVWMPPDWASDLVVFSTTGLLVVQLPLRIRVLEGHHDALIVESPHPLGCRRHHELRSLERVLLRN